ncbi:MAG: hypothetical protein IR153_09720 [Flavobacterium sp.]|nr:hypothetical protein [Flavobacterium sp.]
MKKFLKSAAFAVLALVAISCDKDGEVFDVDGGQTAYMFIDAESNLGVNTESNTRVVRIGVTTRSNQDRIVPVSIDPASTATADQYDLQTSNFVIPAGEFVGEAVITGDFDAIPDGVTGTIILNIDDSVETVVGKNQHIVYLFRSCPTDLAGQVYSVTTNYTAHDFLPQYATNTMNVTLQNATGDNTYRVPDFSGGLYSVGPYNTNYNTGSAGAANQIDLIFTINCDTVTWTGQADPWGPIIATPGGVNSYDAETGVITISWTATGYGETGVSVYTPAN